jgi:hypothetical protein
VDRQGDIWVISSERQQLDGTAHVLALRLEKMQRRGLDHAEMLPLPVQHEIQRALYEEGLAGPIGQEMKRRWEHGNSDARIRNLASAWKTTQFNLYGGQVWLRILIALGDIPDSIVGICNELVAETIRQAQREPSTGLVEGPRLSLRSLAAAQGEVPPPVRGIRHQTSAAKAARETAKRTQRLLLQYKHEWRNGTGRGAQMSWAQWHSMEERLEDLHILYWMHFRVCANAGVEVVCASVVSHAFSGIGGLGVVVIGRWNSSGLLDFIGGSVVDRVAGRS